MRFWLGTHLFIYTDYPNVMEQILNSPNCLDKGQSYRFLAAVLGDSLITLPGINHTYVTILEEYP